MARGMRLIWVLVTLVALIIGLVFFLIRKDRNMDVFLADQGPQVQEVLAVDPFERLNAGGTFHIHLREGLEAPLLEAPANLFGEIQAEVREGTLYLAVNESWPASAVVNVYVKKALTEIDLSGMARLESETPLNAESLRLKAGGMSVIALELNIPHLDVVASGSASFTLGGFTEELTLDCSGSAEVKGEALTALWAIVQTSGSGKVALKVEEHLTANASGSSAVYYTGKPQVEAKASGAAEVKGRE